jgi:hypothetical protein
MQFSPQTRLQHNVEAVLDLDAEISGILAPEWGTSDLKNRVQSGLLFSSTSNPVAVLAEIRAFLSEGVVPAEVSEPTPEKPWTVQAAAFVDNVEVDIEVHVFSHDSNDPFLSMVVFEHRTQNDIVRFHRIASSMCKHAAAHGITMSSQSADVSCPLDCCHEDDFDEMEFEAEDEAVPWKERVESLFTLLESSILAVRLEAVQLLAQWTQTKPDCRFTVAEAFRSRPTSLSCFLETRGTASLCELYLLAVSLRVITECPKAAKLLQQPLSPVLVEAANQSAPKLVLGQIAIILAQTTDTCVTQ